MNEHQDAMDDNLALAKTPLESDQEVAKDEDSLLAILKCIKDNVDSLRGDMSKQFDLYSLMTEHRDRSELMLTKLTDLLNRVYLLDSFSKKELSAAEVSPEVILSTQKRIGALMNYAVRLAGSFGLTPVAPQVGDEFNPEEHLIVGTADVPPGSDVAGKVASCDRMGCIRFGRVTPAEVIVYKDSDTN